MAEIDRIVRRLQEQQVVGKQGQLRFELAGIPFPVSSKDIIGGVLQEWFENWMRQNAIPFRKPDNTQEPPDFFLADDTHLEIKAFNYTANPGFDLANFNAYTRDLLRHPTRLDAEHLVFGYSVLNGNVIIREFWVKKIWQMAGTSKKNHLSLQVKQGEPVNIRPKDWRNRDNNFTSRRAFVTALDAAIQHFYPGRSPRWLDEVTSEYQRQTNTPL